MSPAAFRDARDVAVERELAEAQAAQRELPHVGTRPAAQVAAVPQADLVLRCLLFLGNLCCRGHFVLRFRASGFRLPASGLPGAWSPEPAASSLLPERHADELKQLARFFVGLRGGHD